MSETIRVKAICVFTYESRMLAVDGYDPGRELRFWVPVGGGVELGETSEEAVIREIREEIGAEVTDLHHLGTLENIFTFEGELGHEIVFVYDAHLIDEALYDQEVIPGIENGKDITAHWIDPTNLQGRPLFPAGLPDLLA